MTDDKASKDSNLGCNLHFVQNVLSEYFLVSVWCVKM